MTRPKLKGMRSIRTIQTLRNRALPTSRAEMAGQLARLEHERARLERETKIFTEKQSETGKNLCKVRDQIEQIKRALYGLSRNRAGRDNGRQSSADRRAPSGSGLQKDDGEEERDSKKVSVVNLNY